MSTGPRKMKQKIKPPRSLAPSQSAAAENWALFAKAVQEIHNNNAHQLSYEENYRYAYNLCLYKHGEMLYNGVCDLVSQNLDRMAREVIIPSFPATSASDPIHRSQEGERFLKAFRKVWDDHTRSMSQLRDLLKYMDRTYVLQNRIPPIYNAGLDLFIKLIHKENIETTLLQVVLDQIRIERDDYVINRSAMKGCIDVLLDLGNPTIYTSIMEPALIRESESFYEAEAKKLMDTCDVPEYLRKVESRLSQEESRAMHYISSLSYPAIRTVVHSHLLSACLERLLLRPNSGLDAMINEDKQDDLARLYRVFGLVPLGIPSLKKQLKVSIEERGNRVNTAGEVPEDEPRTPDAKNKSQEKTLIALRWVQEVLDLQDKFLTIWRNSFQSDKLVETAISEGFESFINRNSNSAEFISLFIDENLKKGLKGKTDDEVESVLDKTVSIFRYITDKDVFERYYKNHLSKRLLYGRSVSDDAERGMLAKLKIECGYQFTQKLEGMFNDIRVSADTTEAYKKHAIFMENPTIDLSVTVMTSTFWPMTHSSASCTLPPELQQAIRLFERFYLSRHSGRKLTWQPALGNADVRVAFKTRKHDVNLPTFALVALLLFENIEEGGQLPFEDVRIGTGIPEAELQRALQSLACAKFKILKKHPPSREVSPSDSFSFNHEFSSPLQKIKIGLIASKVETNEERRETRDRIEEERRLQIEACIVRVMKDRKVMPHNDLITEVTKQLSSRFQPVPIEVKKRIEALIERDYLERGEDRKSYHYLA